MKKIILPLIIFLFVSGIYAQNTKVHDLIVTAQKKDSLNMFDEALKDLDEAIKISNHQNDTALWLHGKVSYEKNDLKTAEHDINEVMHHSHKHAEAYFIRGLIKAKTENYEGAIKDFTKSIELRPNSAKAYYDRGLAHAMMDEIKQAMQDFSRAIELDPTYAKAYFNRGYWKDIMGDVEGALADLLKAKELNPKDKEIYLELAVVYARNKKMKEACQELENAAAAGHSISDELKSQFCKE
jgi:Flp pilus assembly protein TadD